MASVRRPIFVGLLIGDLNMNRTTTADRDHLFRSRRAKPGGASDRQCRRRLVSRLVQPARNAVTAGDSLRYVQDMLGHANLNTTQRYLEPSSNAKRKLVDLI